MSMSPSALPEPVALVPPPGTNFKLPTSRTSHRNHEADRDRWNPFFVAVVFRDQHCLSVENLKAVLPQWAQVLVTALDTRGNG